MDFLASEISRQKRKIDSLDAKGGAVEGRLKKGSVNKSSHSGPKEEKSQDETDRLKRLEQEVARTRYLQKVEEQPQKTMNDNSLSVEKELRDLKEPVKLFGESAEDTSRRLKRVVSRIQRHKEHAEQVEREKHIDFVIEPQDVADIDREKIRTQIRAFLKNVLRQWDECKENDDLLVQTKKGLVPLLVQLRKGTIDETMLTTLATTVIYLQTHDYTMANDAYLKLSIGNLAWPIGVVSVGIHARHADEKITGSKNVANIMKDEKTRQWLTAIKRLITFCESREEKKS